MNSPIQNQLNTVFVPVSDLTQSVKWYCDLLGQSYDHHAIQEPIYNMAINHHTGLLLEAGPPGQKQAVEPSKHPLFNFHTHDIREAYSLVQKRGYAITTDIQEFADLAFFNIKDPDGNIVMVCNG
ncbi:VOC family protein [Thalassobacillus sp. CUG 92003]|uniref:VOC family protein n=1 Tax=Thalassobacillus sp. CUG 92003 TaxID=2736641 RepID=UPI0015E736DE|nr:VOC family protein [Thalassobacillus sp. CUG 92003]